MVPLCAALALADDNPRAELYFGYTYFRVNTASNVPAFSANGGNGQFAVDFNKWLGFVADIGAVHNGNIGSNHIDTTLTDYLFGPRVSLRFSRITPFFNILLGGMHASTSTAVSAIPVQPSQPIYLPGYPNGVPANTPVTLRAVASQTGFAFALGGGLDLKITKHVSFRPVELEWALTRLQNLRTANDNNQHNLRYMAGFNFTFGAQ
jgi:hypothetical protein